MYIVGTSILYIITEMIFTVELIEFSKWYINVSANYNNWNQCKY